MDYKEQFENLPFKNDFMFGAVLQDLTLAKRVLAVILAEEIPDIEHCEIQKVVQSNVVSHGVRYDVYIKTPDGTKIYDIEMQTTNNDNLPKRSRYYLSASDMECLNRGKTYDDLPRTYIIFICPFDIFGGNKALYKFENYCVEENLPLNDQSYHVFVNTMGTTQRKELYNLMEYINTNIPTDELTSDLNKRLQEVRHDDMLYSTYVHQQQDRLMAEKKARAEGRAEGKAEGKAEGRIDLIKNLLNVGRSIKEIADFFKTDESEINSLLENA